MLGRSPPAEKTPCAPAENERSDGRVRVQCPQRVDQGLPDRVVDRVALGGTIDDQSRHARRRSVQQDDMLHRLRLPRAR